MKQCLQCVILCLCSVSVYAEMITWFSFNRPPWFMENGQGYGDRIQAKHEALLPQYQHRTIQVNLARMKVAMESGRNFCVAALADLPIVRKYMHTSKSIYILPQPKIFMRQDMHRKMGSPTKLSIKKLAANINYRVGLIRGTPYLPIRVEDYETSSHASIVSGTSPIVSIMKMVDLGRIDWAADYPHIVQWGAVSGEIEIENAFEMVDIAEFEASESLRSMIACTKNSWGREIIDQLNGFLKKDSLLEFREWVSQWMPPGEVKEEFFRLNKNEYGY